MDRLDYFIKKMFEIAEEEQYIPKIQKEKIAHFLKGNILELRVDAELSRESIEYHALAEGPDFNAKNFLTFSSCSSMKKQLFFEMGHALQNYCSHGYRDTPYSVINTKTIWVLK